MSLWFHSTILATSLAATVAVGIASAAIYDESPAPIASKADRLAIPDAAENAPYLTFETRTESGVSVLNRVPATELN